MKLSISTLLVVAHLVPGFYAVPMPDRETCACQPIPPFTRHPESYNSSLASCNRIAQDIQRWRWPLHSPKLADRFVDVSSLELGQPPRKHSSETALGKSILTSPITSLRHEQSRVRPVDKKALFKHAEDMSRSRGTYIEAQQRFRIVCQPRAPTIEPFAPHPFHSLVAIFVGLTLVWLFVFELVAQTWLRSRTLFQPTEGAITLSGEEKRLYAIVLSDELPEDAVNKPGADT